MHTKRSLLAALAAGALIAVCWLLPSSRDAAAGTALRLDLQGLIDRAGLIVEGRVLSKEAREGPRGIIETEYLLDVDRTLLGEDRGQRSIRLPGGILPDGRGLVLPGVPALMPGEDVLLFLSMESRAGLRLPVGLAQGRFRVVVDPATGARALLRPAGHLNLVDPSSGQVRPTDTRPELDYAGTLARIRVGVETRRRRERAADGGEDG